MDYPSVLSKLCTASGPSGFEQAVAGTAATLLSPYVDEITTSRLGSVIGIRKCGKPGAKTLLLDAHLDEIGFLMTGAEEGFLRFTSLGGVDSRMLPNAELLVLSDPPITGVVSCLPPHIQQQGDFDKAIPIKELYLDVGLTQEEAERRVPIGTPAAYPGGCIILGSDRLSGKALDDRSCFAVLLHTAQLLKQKELDVDLIVLGSTREEVNSAGAITAAWALIPDFCVVVDVTHGDTPDSPAEKVFPLGKGPVVGVGPNCAQWMSQRLFEKANAIHIPVQTEVMAGNSGTNAWALQISREGIATANLSLPLRYMHSPIETICLGDLEQTAQLLAAFCENLGKEAPAL